jgi:hypothetical protein
VNAGLPGDLRVPTCDGCGNEVDARHIRERIERLEWATRFRPVHIHVLLIDAAPPAEMDNYFYPTSANGLRPSSGSDPYRREVLRCAGIAPGAGPSYESMLADFQRRGFFLTYAVECPVEEGELEHSVQKLSATTVKRVQYCYRPKNIGLLSAPTLALVVPLQKIGYEGRLILDEGEPFSGLDFSRRFCEIFAAIA